MTRTMTRCPSRMKPISTSPRRGAVPSSAGPNTKKLGKMRVPRMWRAAASAAAQHSQPRGAWLKPRPARGETGLAAALVGRPRPAPWRPDHVGALVALTIVRHVLPPSSRERRLEPSFRTLSPAGRGSSHAPHMG